MLKSKKKLNNTWSNNLYMFKLIFRACPYRVVGEIVMQLVWAFIWIFTSIIFMEYILDSLQQGRSYSEVVIFIIGSMLILTVLNIYLAINNRIILPKGNQELYEKLNLIMFEKVNDVELACYENPEFYKKYTKAASQTKGTALKLIDTIARIISRVVAIAYVSYKLFVIDKFAVLFVVIPIGINYKLGKYLNRLRYEYDMENVEFERQKEYVNRTIYLADYAKEIRLSNIHNVLLNYFEKAIDDIMKNLKIYGKKFAFLSTVQGIISNTVVFIGAIIYAVIRLLLLKNLDLGDFIKLINAITIMSAYLSQMIGLTARLHGFTFYIDNLRSFLQYEPQIAQSQDGKSPTKEEKSLKLDNVTFTYSGDVQPVLKNINMTIEPKQKIALVGHNGAGKSTLVKLIMRLYDVDTGKILLNGENIKKYNVKEYRDLFGVVFQDYKIMSMTVAENVLMGETTLEDREKVEQSLMASGVYDKVMTLEKGIDTMLTREFDAEGAVLSGGEFQKIAISRIFAKDCDFAILDEPSSALDPIAEYKMYESMMKVCEDKGVIFISHRMSSAVLADKIYLLEQGKIIEEGSHKELMELDGKYAQMFKLQAKSYEGSVNNNEK